MQRRILKGVQFTACRTCQGGRGPAPVRSRMRSRMGKTNQGRRRWWPRRLSRGQQGTQHGSDTTSEGTTTTGTTSLDDVSSAGTLLGSPPTLEERAQEQLRTSGQTVKVSLEPPGPQSDGNGKRTVTFNCLGGGQKTSTGPSDGTSTVSGSCIWMIGSTSLGTSTWVGPGFPEELNSHCMARKSRCLIVDEGAFRKGVQGLKNTHGYLYSLFYNKFGEEVKQSRLDTDLSNISSRDDAYRAGVVAPPDEDMVIHERV
ncbi:unnamed protein product [Amoebophrya sp. A120]|nr:unnamed protein product [Amoebophrya sp. A120]|eukprot:GSA120T00012033001.1